MFDHKTVDLENVKKFFFKKKFVVRNKEIMVWDGLIAWKDKIMKY